MAGMLWYNIGHTLSLYLPYPILSYQIISYPTYTILSYPTYPILS